MAGLLTAPIITTLLSGEFSQRLITVAAILGGYCGAAGGAAALIYLEKDLNDE